MPGKNVKNQVLGMQVMSKNKGSSIDDMGKRELISPLSVAVCYTPLPVSAMSVAVCIG